MSNRAQMLRTRLAGAVNHGLSMVYRQSVSHTVRRSFVAVERLEERIVFGGGVGGHNPPYPLASCSDPSDTSTCQTCPPPPITAGPGTGGPGHSGPGNNGPSGPGGPSGHGPGTGNGNGNGNGTTGRVISMTINPDNVAGSAGTEAPINAVGGMPRISSTDLQSNAFGLV